MRYFILKKIKLFNLKRSLYKYSKQKTPVRMTEVPITTHLHTKKFTFLKIFDDFHRYHLS